jgi:hypothetical protein
MNSHLVLQPCLLCAREGGGEGGGIKWIGAQAAPTHLLGCAPVLQPSRDFLLMVFESLPNNRFIRIGQATGDAFREAVGRKTKHPSRRR